MGEITHPPGVGKSLRGMTGGESDNSDIDIRKEYGEAKNAEHLTRSRRGVRNTLLNEDLGGKSSGRIHENGKKNACTGPQ